MTAWTPRLAGIFLIEMLVEAAAGHLGASGMLDEAIIG